MLSLVASYGADERHYLAYHVRQGMMFGAVTA